MGRDIEEEKMLHYVILAAHYVRATAGQYWGKTGMNPESLYYET